MGHRFDENGVTFVMGHIHRCDKSISNSNLFKFDITSNYKDNIYILERIVHRFDENGVTFVMGHIRRLCQSFLKIKFVEM